MITQLNKTRDEVKMDHIFCFTKDRIFPNFYTNMKYVVKYQNEIIKIKNVVISLPEFKMITDLCKNEDNRIGSKVFCIIGGYANKIDHSVLDIVEKNKAFLDKAFQLRSNAGGEHRARRLVLPEAEHRIELWRYVSFLGGEVVRQYCRVKKALEKFACIIFHAIDSPLRSVVLTLCYFVYFLKHIYHNCNISPFVLDTHSLAFFI